MIEQITHVLENRGFIDYQTLSSSESLDVCETFLDQLLEQAYQTFEDLLEEPEATVSFDSFLEPYFQMDETLEMLYTFLSNYKETNSSEKIRQIVQNFQPKITEYQSKISLNSKAYKLLKHIKASPSALNDQQTRALELLLLTMEIEGVHLEGDAKKRLEAINIELSKLSNQFSNNVLDSRQQFFYQFPTDEALTEIPEQDRLNAESEAKNRNLEGWVFTLEPPSLMAIMKYCSDREVRKTFLKAHSAVASSGDYDNRGIVLDILKLRQEKAELLGFTNFAEYILQSRMANSTQDVEEKLKLIGEAARKKAKVDLGELKTFSGLDQLEAWDVAYYSDKLMKEKYNINEKELKNYFPLEQTLQGMFGIAKTLFNLEFKLVEVPTYDSDVLNYEVYRGGELQAYFIFDLFARKSKRGGAWCNNFRDRKKLSKANQLPIVINVSNFGKSSDNMPTLLTHGEVCTMFHEFGHALHLILSENDYKNLSGFGTEWDFVELPSQLMENWVWHKESLATFAKHFETGVDIPDSILKPLQDAKTLMSGHHVLRQNEFGSLDWLLHTEAIPHDVETLDKRCLEIAQRYTIIPKSDDYRMYCSFGHIFAGGYAAGYYSYLWAEILEADIFERFKAEGVLNPTLGEAYRKTVLAAGAKRTGAQIFQDFMGRDPDVTALQKKYKFMV